MAENLSSPKSNVPRIMIEKDGPYHVYGNVPLVRKRQVVSEYGEPLTWQKEGEIETQGTYTLCRCGHSANKPFCDMSHLFEPFDGSETADLRPTAERQKIFVGTNIIVRRDYSLCSEAGFCGTRSSTVEQMVPHTSDTHVRSLVIAMVERCPSGSFTYAIAEGEPDIEPDLPQQIAVTTEITSEGPIQGPLWVTGYVPIERSDGHMLETRNRVTLCCCGKSKNKPLCDGSHRTEGHS